MASKKNGLIAALVGVTIAIGAEAGAKKKTPDIWSLDVKCHTPRTLKVEIPGRGERVITFVRFEVTNNTPQGRVFVPSLRLTADKGAVDDEIFPSAEEKIRALEDFAGAVDLRNTITLARDPIPPGKKVTGLAMWAGVDPSAKRLTIHLRGFSNGFLFENDKTHFHKTMEFQFQRTAKGFEAVGPGEWVYRLAEKAK